MAEPTQFIFDSMQRSVRAARPRRRRTLLWIVASLALHGAVVLVAFSGAARGGRSEMLGTMEVAIVGPVSAGDPDGKSADGDTRGDAGPQPRRTPLSAIAQPAPPAAEPPKSMPLPKPADAKTMPKAEPLPQLADAAPLRPVPPPPPSAKPTPPPRPAAAHAPKATPVPEAPAPRKALRRGVKAAPKGETAALGSPKGGDRLGPSDSDDGDGIIGINLNPRFRSPPPPPHYPRVSVAREEEGLVLVRALVNATGAPQRVVVWRSSGYPNLDGAALDAVRGWRFEPMVRGGRAVASWVQVPVRFRLN
jgi:protein TonB